jgi:hypothetical protein
MLVTVAVEQAVQRAFLLRTDLGLAVLALQNQTILAKVVMMAWPVAHVPAACLLLL